MAGGTGGHIMPGLAVAHVLANQGWTIRWLGNPNKMEGKLVGAAGYKMIPILFAGVRGKGLSDLIKAPLALLKACRVTWKEASLNRPNVVLGMGGYVAMPGGIVSWLRGIPLVLHEQNAVAGMTNRWLAKIARVVLAGFPGAIPGATVVGNPVRAALLDVASPVKRYEARSGNLHLLVVGGSLGAAALNQVVPAALALIPEELRPVVIHQAGEKHLDALQNAYQQAGVQATCTSFIDDMAAAMASADLMICRAGAMTVAEVAAVGVAALFVPFPHAVDDHQTDNARFLVDQHAAWLIQQRDLSAQTLSKWLMQRNRQELTKYAVHAHANAKPQSAYEIARFCERVSGVSS